MRRPFAGCTTKIRWRQKNWPRASVSSIATPGTWKITRSLRLPKKSGESSMNADRSVLWDMDGTLIDSEEFHWISWRETLAGEGIAITRDQFLASFGRRNDSIIPQWLGAAANPERITRIANAKEELYRDLVRKNGMQI